VYVLNTWGDSLNVLRRTGRALPQSYFHAGNHPRRVSVDPVTHYAYVANAYSDNVTVLDGSQYTVTYATTITVGDSPQAILVHPTNGYIYVGNRGGNSISILQGLSNVATIPPQYYPATVEINPTNHYAYVPMRGGNTVRIYNGSTMLQEVPVGHNPRHVAFNTTTNQAYVPNLDSDSVSVINSSYQVIATVNVQHGPVFTTVDEVNNRIYVLNWYSDTVSVINGATNTVVGTVPVGANPRRAAIDPATNYVYVASAFGNTVSVLNGASVVATLAPGQEPRFVLYNPANGYMYVSNKTDGTVSVFNGLTKLSDVPVGSQPEDMAVDAAGNVYVANFGSNSVSVIQGTSVVDTIPVGSGPEGLAAGFGQVFVVNSLDNTLSVIEGGQVSATYSVGQSPRTVAYDPSSDRAYVSNYEGASLSVVMPEAPRAAFTATPLNGSAPLDVQFTSVVTGAVTSYSWNFGDGGAANIANPNYVYTSAGSFGIDLTVTGPGGSTLTHRDAYVIISPPPGAPSAEFSADITSGQPPLQVTFTAVITGSVDTWSGILAMAAPRPPAQPLPIRTPPPALTRSAWWSATPTAAISLTSPVISPCFRTLATFSCPWWSGSHFLRGFTARLKYEPAAPLRPIPDRSG
jgi:YVTN family beta-propeller protein